MIKFDKRAQGWLLLASGFFFIWLGSYFRAPLLAEHKILVASKSEDGGNFESSVILIMQHNPTGAYGFIVNKDGFGGPLAPDQSYVLHSPEVMLKDSVLVEDFTLAVSEGAAMLEEKPRWHLAVKGYAGWGGRQLDREIRRGVWKVIDYDRKLITETPPEKMHAEAEKRPEAVLDKTSSQPSDKMPPIR